MVLHARPPDCLPWAAIDSAIFCLPVTGHPVTGDDDACHHETTPAALVAKASAGPYPGRR